MNNKKSPIIPTNKNQSFTHQKILLHIHIHIALFVKLHDIIHVNIDYSKGKNWNFYRNFMRLKNQDPDSNVSILSLVIFSNDVER